MIRPHNFGNCRRSQLSLLMVNTENSAPIPQAAPKAGAARAAGSLVALLALGLIAFLAFHGATQPSLADKISLLFLAVASGLCLLPPLWRAIDANPDAATFVLSTAFFIIYSLARRAGPDDGWALPIAALKDAPIMLPWSAYLALGAVLPALLLARPRLAAPVRAYLAAVAVVGFIGCVLYKFLGHFFPVGITSVLNPELLFYTLLQSVEYGVLLLLCNTVCSHAPVRRIAMRLLPLILLSLWARHQFAATPVEDDE